MAQAIIIVGVVSIVLAVSVVLVLVVVVIAIAVTIMIMIALVEVIAGIVVTISMVEVGGFRLDRAAAIRLIMTSFVAIMVLMVMLLISAFVGIHRGGCYPMCCVATSTGAYRRHIHLRKVGVGGMPTHCEAIETALHVK
jgi:hypothetical protein